MSFDVFMETAWNQHAEQTRIVAARLTDSLHLIDDGAQLGRYAALAVHVFGEHLGEWNRGIEVLQAMQRLPFAAAALPVLNRHLAALTYAAGDAAALEALGPEDRIAALATAAAALTGRGDVERGLAAFRAALALAAGGLPDGSPAHRALAVAANNLATTLEARSDRSEAETQGMVEAAEAGLTCWRRAGSWLEVERAAYRLARSLLQAQRPAEALLSANQCAEICAHHDAPAFERFFAHAVQAMAHRAAGDGRAFETARQQAMDCHARVPADEKTWCEADLAVLNDGRSS